MEETAGRERPQIGELGPMYEELFSAADSELAVLNILAAIAYAALTHQCAGERCRQTLARLREALALSQEMAS